MKKISILIFTISFMFSYPSFNIMSFNIQGFNSKKNIKKISKILNEVKDFHVFSIQENWSFEKFFLKKIENFNYIIDRSKNIFNSTGLSIILRKSVDILDQEIINFSDCNGFLFYGSDCLVSKGFIFARVNFSNKIIDLYNTHLDSGNSKKDKRARKTQLKQLSDYIKNKKSSYPVIIMGDLNIDYYNDEGMITTLASDLELNFVKWDENYFLEKKIDYIFFKNSSSNYEWLLSNDLYEISDHPPMSTKIKFKQ